VRTASETDSKCSARQQIHRVKTIFNDVTHRYDLLNRIMSARQDVHWRRRLAKLLTDDTRVVLDIATGTGDLAIEILKHKPHSKVYGIDFVPRMLEYARVKTAGLSRNEKINFCIGDGTFLPFADDSFDAAVIAFGLRNIPDRSGALKEMVRVVRPGGKVLVLEMTFSGNLGLRPFFDWYLNRMIPFVGGLISGNPGAYRYLPDSIQDFLHPDELSDLFRQAGLNDVKAHPLTFGIAYIHEGVVTYPNPEII